MMKRFLITAAVLSLATQVYATEGINLIGIGPVQQGTAGAGVASAKDSTWTILNPAGLTYVESGLDVSVQLFAPVRTMNSSVGGDGSNQEDDSVFFIPSISTSFKSGWENGTIGMGIYGTSGMGAEYDYGRIGNLQTGSPQNDGDKMTELSVMKMALAYAHDLGNGLSIGGGPLLLYSRLKTDMLDNTFSYSSGEWDDAYGIGFILGVDKKWESFSLGASYMSEQFMSEFDDYEMLLNGSLNSPQQLTVGAAYNLTSDVEMALDYRWLGWGKLDTLGDQFGWKDQHIVKLGLTWDVIEALALRGGISYGNSPIDEDTTFSNALFPAIMETHLTLGASYKWEKMSLHLAYVHALKNEITANGNDSAANGMGNFGAGTEISMYQNSLTLGMTYHF